MSVSTIQLESGQRVKGLYRRGGRDSRELELAVNAIINYNGSAMLVGTDLGNGRVIAVYAECFHPAHVEVSDGIEGDALDVSAYFITTGTRAFSFLEKPSDVDASWARIMGGKPMSEFEQLAHALLLVAEG